MVWKVLGTIIYNRFISYFYYFLFPILIALTNTEDKWIVAICTLIIQVQPKVIISKSKADLIRQSINLQEKAGPEFYRACWSLDSPKLGLVQETDGYNLSCKKVLHCYLPPFKEISEPHYVSHYVDIWIHFIRWSRHNWPRPCYDSAENKRGLK